MNQFRLVSLKVCGFRGFPQGGGEKEFNFDQPCTLIFGTQGGSKSSTLHAIEWCLFGDKVAKATETGIAERKGWLIRNKRSTEATVEAVFERPGQVLRVWRSDTKRTGQRRFFYQINGGAALDSEEGLRALVGTELRDYMSCVHLHQEVVDALLVEEPAARKNAMDRLMGLADLRNFMDAIKKAKVGDELKHVDTLVQNVEAGAASTLRIRQSDLARVVAATRQLGLEESVLSFEGARASVERIASDMRRFATDCELTMSSLPPFQTIEGLDDFLSRARAGVKDLRNQQPALQRQASLLKRKTTLASLKSDYEAKLAEFNGLESQMRQLEHAHGPATTTQSRLEAIRITLLPSARDRLSAVHSRAGLIGETVKFLESAQTEPVRDCPVCGLGPIDAARIREELMRWQSEMGLLLAPIKKEIADLEAETGALETVGRQWQQLEGQRKARKKEVEEASQSIINTLGQRPGDLAALLALESQKVEAELAAQHAAVQQSNSRLDALEEALERVKQIVFVLKLKREVNELLEIKESPEYREVEAARDRLRHFASWVKAIEAATAAALGKLAEQKIQKTREAICSIYRELAQRQDYPEIAIDPEKYEVMAVRDGESELALRLLNKGDLNCAALSIFLALATSSELNHSLGFIVLDDPSQSLDQPHQERLAAVLDRMRGDKQLILATSEAGFLRQLQTKLKAKQRTYTLERWTEEAGPQISGKEGRG